MLGVLPQEGWLLEYDCISYYRYPFMISYNSSYTRMSRSSIPRAIKIQLAITCYRWEPDRGGESCDRDCMDKLRHVPLEYNCFGFANNNSRLHLDGRQKGTGYTFSRCTKLRMLLFSYSDGWFYARINWKKYGVLEWLEGDCSIYPLKWGIGQINGQWS